MKIIITTLEEDGEDKIYTEFYLEKEKLNCCQLAFAISELEKIKQELLEMWKEAFDYRIEKDEEEEVKP